MGRVNELEHSVVSAENERANERVNKRVHESEHSDVSAENRRVNELEHSVVSAENKRVNERIDERVNEKEHSVVSAENKKISSDNKRKSEGNAYEKKKRGKVETNTSNAWKSGQRFQGIDP